MSTFRLRAGPTVLLVLAALIFLPLCFWQISRFAERRAWEQLRDQRIALEPLPFDSLADVADGNDLRRVVLSGELDLNRVAFVRHAGSVPRCSVVSPLTLPGGGTILVDRGWIEVDDRMSCSADSIDAPDGKPLIGLLHEQGEIPDIRARASRDEPRVWAAYDLQGMYDAWEIDPRPERSMIVTLEREHGSKQVRSGHDHITDPYLSALTHLSYAVTWFMVFAVCVGFWIVMCFGVFDRAGGPRHV